GQEGADEGEVEVVHQHGRAGGRQLGGAGGESLVHAAVAGPRFAPVPIQAWPPGRVVEVVEHVPERTAGHDVVVHPVVARVDAEELQAESVGLHLGGRYLAIDVAHGPGDPQSAGA